MKNKKLLLILALLLIFCFVLIALSLAYVLVIKDGEKDDDKKEIQTTQDEDENDEDSEIVTEKVDMYAYANCKVYKIDKTDVDELTIKNNSGIKCFENKIFRNDYAFLQPVYDNLAPEKFDLFLLDVKLGTIIKINVGTGNHVVADYNRESGKLYTYILKDSFTSETKLGVYEGTLQNVFAKKIFDPKGVVEGRGLSPFDNVSLKLSPDKNRILITDTFSSSDEGKREYNNILILNLTGQKIAGISGPLNTFGHWLNNNEVVYLGEDSDMNWSLHKYNISSNTSNIIKKMEGETIYAIDVFRNKLNIEYFNNNQGEESPVLPNIVEVIDLSKSSVSNSSNTKKFEYDGAGVLFYGNTDLISFSVTLCKGYYSDDPRPAHPCSEEGGSNPFYQQGIQSYDMSDKEVESLITFNKVTMLTLNF